MYIYICTYVYIYLYLYLYLSLSLSLPLSLSISLHLFRFDSFILLTALLKFECLRSYRSHGPKVATLLSWVCLRTFEVSINGEFPKWLVYNGKPIYQWMITGGTPISGNHHFCRWEKLMGVPDFQWLMGNVMNTIV